MYLHNIFPTVLSELFHVAFFWLEKPNYLTVPRNPKSFEEFKGYAKTTVYGAQTQLTCIIYVRTAIKSPTHPWSIVRPPLTLLDKKPKGLAVSSYVNGIPTHKQRAYICIMQYKEKRPQKIIS